MEKKEKIKKVKKEPEFMTVTRLLSFSDAVFAVAITLLILDIRVPDIAKSLVDKKLPSILISMEPKFTAFALTFILIGIFWSVHHALFHYIKRYNRGLFWLNLFFLIFIVFLPFSTSLMSTYYNHQVPIIFYSLNMAFIGLSNSFLWWYASNKYRLIDKEMEPVLIRHITLENLMTPIVALIVIAVSFIHVRLAQFFWLLIPIIHIPHEFKKRHLR